MPRHIIKKINRHTKKIINGLQWLPIYWRFQRQGYSWAWKIYTHLSREERLLLYYLGLQCGPGAQMLEVGSYLGASATFMAVAASEIGKGAKVHCVDTWQNEGMTEGRRDTWQEFKTNTAPLAEYIVPHRGLSVDIAENFHGRLDLLFIDGDHSYEACKADVMAWLNKLRPGGLIVLHDFGWAVGVQKVVAEIIKPRERQTGKVFQNTYWTRI